MGKSNFQKLIIVINIITIIIFLIFRFQYGMNRYFDIDEFAHLHWSHNVLVGLRPYTDFFYFLPPLYLYLLLPLFWITSKSTAILLLSRGLSFGVFLLVLGTLFVLVKKIRNVHIALLSILILAFLPIPTDKWLEIRPDGVAVLFSLLGMLFLTKGIRDKKKSNLFLSGLFYALGVLTIPKVILFAGVALTVVLLARLKIKTFILGSILPIIVVVLLFFAYGDIGKSFYLVTKIAADASAVLGSKFPIPANFLFYPNDVYYGSSGYSLPWLMNLLIWWTGIIWGILRLVSFLDKKDIKESLIEFLVAASFFVNIFAFVKIFPLRHAQYLMPISVFIAFYFADFITLSCGSYHLQFSARMRLFSETFGDLLGGRIILFPSSLSESLSPKTKSTFHISVKDRLSMLLKKLILRRKYTISFMLPIFFLLLVFLVIFFAGREMYGWKLRWSSLNLSYYSTLFKLLPEGEKVYDLTGEAIFSPDGYYFCCIPYGQYEEVLGQKPDLERELRRNKVKFVYMQNEGRLSVLPRAHDAVLRKYYTIYPSGNPPFLLVAGALVGFEKENLEKEFDLISGGKYLLIWNNKILTVSDLSWLVEIDGKKVAENPVEFSEGIHKITVSEKGLMKIMYSW